MIYDENLVSVCYQFSVLYFHVFIFVTEYDVMDIDKRGSIILESWGRCQKSHGLFTALINYST